MGVAPQYVSALSKNANCQTLVSTTLAQGEVLVMIGLRLFLPESRTSDPVCMRKARVLADRQAFRMKLEIAIEEIDHIKGTGARFGCVLADVGYGLSAPFRQALSARGLRWTVGISCKQKVYLADVALIFPVADRGRPCKRHIPGSKPVAVETMLANASWRTLSWRRCCLGKWPRKRSHRVKRKVRKFRMLLVRIELTASPLPRECSTTELQQHESRYSLATATPASMLGLTAHRPHQWIDHA